MLRSLHAAHDQVDGAWIRLLAAEWRRNKTLHLSFTISRGRRGRVASAWHVQALHVLEHCIQDADGGGFAEYRNPHPAVRQHLDPGVSLSIARPVEYPDLALGEIWRAHQTEVDDWIPLDRYLPAASELRDRLATGGKLCFGPRFLLKRYAACLRRAGAKPVLRDAPSSRQASQAKGLTAIHFGESFVVARSFLASEIRDR